MEQIEPLTVKISLPEQQIQLISELKLVCEKLLASNLNTLWLTEPQAAQRLKVSMTTIRKWRNDGWLRYFAEGHNIRYRMDYLDSDFEARTLVQGFCNIIKPCKT